MMGFERNFNLPQFHCQIISDLHETFSISLILSPGLIYRDCLFVGMCMDVCSEPEYMHKSWVV